MDIKKTENYFEGIRENALKIISEKEFQKEIVFAAQHMQKNYKLTENKPAVLREVYNAINLGFTLNPIMDYANLIPVFQKGGIDVQFRPTYKGMIWAAKHYGASKDIYSYCVYKGDEFRRTLGTNVEIYHEPKDLSKEIVKVYAVAILEDGSKRIEILDKQDLDKIKDCSDGYKYAKKKPNGTNPWIQWEDEMSRKSAIKRLCKYLPKVENFEKVIEADNREYKIDPVGSFADYIKSLISSSTYDEREKIRLDSSVNDMTHFEAQKLFADLQGQQPEPMYSENGDVQGDINKALDNVLKQPNK